MVDNSYFPKIESHLVTFCSTVAKTQIDYLLLKKGDKGLCKDCKVNPSDNHTIQHKLLVMDLEIKRERGKNIVYEKQGLDGVDLPLPSLVTWGRSC